MDRTPGTDDRGAHAPSPGLSTPPTGVPQLARLVQIVARLRAPDGCPWDREQSMASMAPHLLEEAFEAVDAIQAGQEDGICEELGDVLMNVVLIAQIAGEAGRFDVERVAREIGDKLIRRHPHVFANLAVSGSEQVLANWERIKQQEKAADAARAKGVLSGVPAALPALLRAYRIGEKAARVGFDWPDPAGPRAKVDEELAELDRALAQGDPAAVQQELGDVLFSLVNLARHAKVNPEMALRATMDKFVRRFAHVEERLGERMGTADLAEMDRLWNEAKLAEK